MPASWSVYILQSVKTGMTYTGATTDFPRRLRQHNGEIAGGARSTRRGRPWLALHVEGPMSKADALRRELAIKRWPRKRKLAIGCTSSRSHAEAEMEEVG